MVSDKRRGRREGKEKTRASQQNMNENCTTPQNFSRGKKEFLQDVFDRINYKNHADFRKIERKR